MTLGDKQRLFMRLLQDLLTKIHRDGYEVTGGELERVAVAAEWYAVHCQVCQRHKTDKHVGHKFKAIGIRDSLHRIRLAIDLNLFLDGVYLTSTDDHRPFGEYWEDLHELCRWGGRFGDGNHYSLEHEGRA